MPPIKAERAAPLPLLTIREASIYLRMSVKTLRRRIDDGDIPVFRDGRMLRIRYSDLNHYITVRMTSGNQ